MKQKLKRTAAILIGLLMAIPVAGNIKQTSELQANAASQVLAFPGAVGGGSYATGGRGGEVVHVTNLNDSGAGSFRDAVSKSNRIVVFDVSGTIELKSNVLVSSNVTIAGQTAPGGSGITLKNYKLGMSGDNIICRYLSSRPGPYKATSSGNDAWGGAKGSNSIIDHCSMSWTTDEQWGLYSNNEYYTVQYSIIGPADSWGGHSKGIHGFGMMMGKGYSTFDHNLIVHNVSRNFRGKVVGTSTADFTNNVIYNWAYQTAYGTIGHLNYVNNTLKMGNGTTGGKHYVSVDSSTNPENFKIYLDGNRMLNKDDSIYTSITDDNWAGISVKSGLGITKEDVKSTSAFETNVNGINVSTALTAESAADSYEHVVAFAGNGISPELRTAVDQQVTNETKTGTGNLSGTASYEEATDENKEKIDNYHIQCSTEYTYPAPVLEKTIVDSDNDGMPDEWELLRGLNPNDPSDVNGDYCEQGYTNIEYYINDLTVDSFPAGVVTRSPETATVEPISAYETIEAENYSSESGIRVEECSEGGQNVGYIENGDYLLFQNVDFEDGAKQFIARLAGGAAGIELYLDSLESTPVANLSFGGSGSWQVWTDAAFNINTISGKHDLYLKFTGGDGYLVNINYFVFEKKAIPQNGKLIHELTILDTENSADWKISDGADIGTLIFGDRDFTFTSLPDILQGAEMICTACDSKNADTATELAHFKAGADIVVYTAVDTRVEQVPAFLADWETTEMTCTSSNEVSFQIYQKKFSQGEIITLGSNGQSYQCVNYIVFATLPMEVPEPPMLVGDINADGNVNAADAVMLQKYLLSQDILTEIQWKAADLHTNGKVNGMDLGVLRTILLSCEN